MHCLLTILLTALLACLVPTVSKNSSLQEPEEDTSNYTTTESGLKYLDITEGIGRTPEKGQRLIVHYTGYLTNGKKFDSSYDKDRPFEFILGAGHVIKGWEEGLSNMKAGGRRRLVIPSSLAYGSKGKGDIPPNATLIFDIELLNIRNEKQRRPVGDE
ncbi:MAG: FKBP-type peptidyl-prolyl cis-trans isomerase [Blastocatellia bacterium]|nr:FKBP-type peptidyl-prolyl cis-trans isomerase [Blastocatellia bacterium]